MTFGRILRTSGTVALIAALAGCGGGIGSGKLFGSRQPAAAEPAPLAQRGTAKATNEETIWSLFSNAADPNTTVEVNKYLWQASLEVLDFLPVQSVDPFTGVIVTGYGTPPGGGRSYRATILVQDPALDARSLNVALQGSGGAPVAADTVRAVEDAILTRARQLRIRDSKL